MKKNQRDLRIDNDSDFIISKRFGNSLVRLLNKYPDGVPDKIICRVLQITPEEMKKHYGCAIMKIKKDLE